MVYGYVTNRSNWIGQSIHETMPPGKNRGISGSLNAMPQASPFSLFRIVHFETSK